MPVRAGIDLVAIATVQAAAEEHGDRYLQRVYTPRELAASQTAAGTDFRRLAACFAAKEAALKALRAGPDAAVPWTAIEVARDDDGSFRLELSGAAAEIAARAGLGDLSVSVTSEPAYAAAVVIASFSAALPIMAA